MNAKYSVGGKLLDAALAACAFLACYNDVVGARTALLWWFGVEVGASLVLAGIGAGRAHE